MLPPVWCASHVVGEKPPRAAWDRPPPGPLGRLPGPRCGSCRLHKPLRPPCATGWASATSQETRKRTARTANLPKPAKGPGGGPKPPAAASLRPHRTWLTHHIRVAAYGTWTWSSSSARPVFALAVYLRALRSSEGRGGGAVESVETDHLARGQGLRRESSQL